MELTLSFLLQYPLLNVLAEEERNQIISLIRLERVTKDVCLYLEGETSNKLFFVFEGWFKAEKSSIKNDAQVLPSLSQDSCYREHGRPVDHGLVVEQAVIRARRVPQFLRLR